MRKLWIAIGVACLAGCRGNVPMSELTSQPLKPPIAGDMYDRYDAKGNKLPDIPPPPIDKSKFRDGRYAPKITLQEKLDRNAAAADAIKNGGGQSFPLTNYDRAQENNAQQAQRMGVGSQNHQ